MRRLFAIVIVAAIAAVTGCSGPPPALPTKVLEQGAEALPEEHPELTAEQVSACGTCHRASDAPAQ